MRVGKVLEEMLNDLLNKQSICEALHRYCVSVDLIDEDLWWQVWHPDARGCSMRRCSRAVGPHRRSCHGYSMRTEDANRTSHQIANIPHQPWTNRRDESELPSRLCPVERHWM